MILATAASDIQNRRGTRFIAGGAIYGCVLLVVAAMLSGMGEGPGIAAAILGSPLTVFRSPIVIPITWTIVGVLLGCNYRKLAGLWLSLHTVMIPFAITANLRAEGWSAEWEFARRMYRGDPLFAALLWSVYVLGYVGSWVLIFRKRAKTDTT